jgi:ribonuclease Z
MTKLIILGSSNAIPSLDHENTHMAITSTERTVLIDCASNPVVRLEQAGLDVNTVTDIILTHFHPDHVSGVPLLLMDMWLMGRRRPLNIYGLHYTLDRMETMMGLYGWIEWPNFFTVNFCRVPADEMAIVFDGPDMCVYSSPAKHFLPNIGLRVELKLAKKILAYSCDTEPCPPVFDLARGADILLHEASGNFMGHSSAAQAGDVAQQAGVGALYLIHYPTGRYASGDLVAEARDHFDGEIKLAMDFMKIDLDQ